MKCECTLIIKTLQINYKKETCHAHKNAVSLPIPWVKLLNKWNVWNKIYGCPSVPTTRLFRLAPHRQEHCWTGPLQMFKAIIWCLLYQHRSYPLLLLPDPLPSHTEAELILKHHVLKITSSSKTSIGSALLMGPVPTLWSIICLTTISLSTRFGSGWLDLFTSCSYSDLQVPRGVCPVPVWATLHIPLVLQRRVQTSHLQGVPPNSARHGFLFGLPTALGLLTFLTLTLALNHTLTPFNHQKK